MDTEVLYGNDTIKQRLNGALAKGRLSHCYLLCGPEGSGKRTLARYIAAMMECTSAAPPCGHCSQCRKLSAGTHPDLITVDAPDKAAIPVKLVREACADLFVRPNEGRRKIYLFPRAQALNPQGQNALLKCIEEPPPYGVFLLLCEHAEQLLPTIRSRCVELSMNPLPPALLEKALRRRFPDASGEAIRTAIAHSDGWLGQAEQSLREAQSLLPQSVAFCAAFCGGEALPLLQAIVPLEKKKRDELRTLLLQWKLLLSAALTGSVPYAECRLLAAKRTPAALLAAIETIDRALAMLDANVSPAHVCGMLAVRLVN